MNGFEVILAAAAGGVLPALAWLWFWRREDAAHPEPRRLIALAFFAGMVTVAIVIPMERFVEPIIKDLTLPGFIFASQTLVFTAWSFIEEIMKFLAARFTVLKRREDDEPIDPVIYMITVALGFAAAENTLFLISPIGGETFVQTFITGNLRFIGATLLHVLSSAVIGVALGLSFYASKRIKRRYMIGGVILACLLHSAFNFFILNTAEDSLFRTFSFVWLGVIALLAVLEYIKRIHPQWRRN
ncbi:MAG: PrsW family intramembrane metalloprotease [Candidatus Pacebacteria bacterium]|nr:PrsW family intramembrane metalloprotease [Candidatus Paceibacterota bacterium]